LAALWEASATDMVLGCICYDPAAAVTKTAAASTAMTALDTTNLRLTFTVPSNGIVLVRMACNVHGSTTWPQILLGVMNGATVVARAAGMAGLAGTALATTTLGLEAAFVVTGLTPGASLTWDAAYSVETAVLSTGIKYGGPNDTTANNAFGGFCYEIWST
jgi:hypothetical protein